MPSSPMPMASASVGQRVEVERRAHAEVRAVRVEERRAALRPSSRSMQKNGHSAMSLDE